MRMLIPARCQLATRRGTGGAASFTSPTVVLVVLAFAKQNRREVLHVLLRTKAIPHGSQMAGLTLPRPCTAHSLLPRLLAYLCVQQLQV